MGYALTEENIEKAFEKFKVLADKKKEITEPDLESIIAKEVYTVPEVFAFESMKITSGTKSKPTAELKLKKKGKLISGKGYGVGTIDAIYNTIEKLTGVNPKLVDYSIQAITGGTDALGEVTVRIEEEGNIYAGHGADIDILVASAKAYLAAINRLLNKAKTPKGLHHVM